MPTAEEADVMRNLKESALRAFKSKRILRILAAINERGWIEYDPFKATAELTQEGQAALKSVEAKLCRRIGR